MEKERQDEQIKESKRVDDSGRWWFAFSSAEDKSSKTRLSTEANNGHKNHAIPRESNVVK